MRWRPNRRPSASRARKNNESCRNATIKRERDRTNGPEVLIGAGVNAGVIRQLSAALPGARAYHMSGKVELESRMVFRREGVPMGLPGLDEWHIQQTDTASVRAARQVLDDLA